MRTSPGSAACWSRAATLTASPVARPPPARCIADDDLTGVDPDPHRDLEAAFRAELLVQGTEGGAHLGGGADCPESVVLVEHRDAEDGHDGVPDELLDRAAMSLEDDPHRLEPATHDRAQ